MSEQFDPGYLEWQKQMKEERFQVVSVVNRSDCCDVNLFTTDTLLRYKSEWDPRKHGLTKGGYLEGEIRVPKVVSIC